MKRLLEVAIEQLRWQFDHNPEKDQPHGFYCVKRREVGDAQGVPDCMMVYAQGNAALVLYAVLKANGLTEDHPDATRIPPKPNMN